MLPRFQTGERWKALQNKVWVGVSRTVKDADGTGKQGVEVRISEVVAVP